MLTLAAYVKADNHTIKSIPHTFALAFCGLERLNKKNTTLYTLNEYCSYYSPLNTALSCGEIQSLSGLTGLLSLVMVAELWLDRGLGVSKLSIEKWLIFRNHTVFNFSNLQSIFLLLHVYIVEKLSLHWCHILVLLFFLLVYWWSKFVWLQQSPFIESLEVAERAEYHVMSHPQTFPRGLAPDYRAVGPTLGRRGKNLFAPQASLTPSRPVHKATAVFGHAGGRLVVPNTGEPSAGKIHWMHFCV